MSVGFMKADEDYATRELALRFVSWAEVMGSASHHGERRDMAAHHRLIVLRSAVAEQDCPLADRPAQKLWRRLLRTCDSYMREALQTPGVSDRLNRKGRRMRALAYAAYELIFRAAPCPHGACARQGEPA